MDRPSPYPIRPLSAADAEWVENFIRARWGAEKVVAHGEVFYPRQLPGFLALQNGQPVGLVTCSLSAQGCEIVTLDSLFPRKGIGTALVQAAEGFARSRHCRRLWLITTNDNLDALRFYQRYGFRLVALYPGAVDRSRLIKPEIPAIGNFGIPLRDEIELAIQIS